MKFGQLIQHDMRNIFVDKSYTKCVGETIPRPLSRKSKFSISLDQEFKVLNSLLPLYANLRGIEIWSNQAANHLLLPNVKLFKKIKSSHELVFLPHFQHDF